MAGKPNLASAKKTIRNDNAPQIISLTSGRMGLGASWQSSTSPPVLEDVDALLGLMRRFRSDTLALLGVGRSGEAHETEQQGHDGPKQQSLSHVSGS